MVWMAVAPMASAAAPPADIAAVPASALVAICAPIDPVTPLSDEAAPVIPCAAFVTIIGEIDSMLAVFAAVHCVVIKLLSVV